jgi:hypothetical protein
MICYPAEVTIMRPDRFFSMRQLNFILWMGALLTTWRDPTHLPNGHQWIPIAGVIVSLFWPARRKAEAVAIAANPTAG